MLYLSNQVVSQVIHTSVLLLLWLQVKNIKIAKPRPIVRKHFIC